MYVAVHLAFPPINFYPPQKLFDSPPYTDPWRADNTPTPCLGHVCKSQMVRLRDLWKEVTPSVPIEQGVVARSGGKVVKTVKSSPFSFDRGNAANLIHKICPLVHCTELGGDVRSTMEEDVRRALCYDRRHKQLVGLYCVSLLSFCFEFINFTTLNFPSGRANVYSCTSSS